MTINPINIGSAPNDGNGQDLRSGGQVINDNFAELDARTSAAQAKADQGVSDAATAKSAADAARAKADAAVPGAALGVSVAQLVNGVVPAGQLPSYVDDVLEYPKLADFPATGETGKIYIAINDGDSPTNPTRQYRWSGTAFVLIPASPGSTDQVPEGTTNLYFTAARVRATLLSGLGAAVNAAILASDTILQAFAKLQGQINAKLGASEAAADSAKLNGQAASFYTAPMVGATASADGIKGLVPAPPAGAAVRVLSSLGTWISQATGGAWGAITGNIADQADLKSALDAKATLSSLPITKEFKSADASYTNGGQLSITHGLNAEVKEVIMVLTCVVADNQFAVGRKVIGPISADAYSGSAGVSIDITDPNTAIVRIAGNGITMVSATSGSASLITPTSWRIALRLKA